MESAGLRLQKLAVRDQVLVVSRIAQARSVAGRFGPAGVDELFDALGLPRPGSTSGVLSKLGDAALLARLRAANSWRLTPAGTARSLELMDDLDLQGVLAEASVSGAPLLARLIHPALPPHLAPPSLIRALRDFLAAHPFDRNVFGMTRFPDEQDQESSAPLEPVLHIARDACRSHGLEFHLASDRAMVDDLWSNVAAHMWASRYGIAFLENRRGRGLNYNLTIEVGAMLLAGRRLALLKDASVGTLPTDLVDKIYKPVEFDDHATVREAVHKWIRDDLTLGACPDCPAV